MSDKVYQSGNTIRLLGKFYDDFNNEREPNLVKIRIYNHKYELIQESVIEVENKLESGEWYYDYLTPENPQIFIYEWYAEFSGMPSLKRGRFRTTFI